MTAVRSMRSGEVARAAGVNAQTLRYYERRGLIAEPMRTDGGHRAYPPDTVTTLRVIKAAQRLGFTLQEVSELLEVGQHRHGRPRPRLQERARAKVDEVDARIADLQAIRTTLLEAIDAGCDDLGSCVVSECCPIPFVEIASHAPVAAS